MLKKDKLWFGIVLGLLAPFVGLLVYYFAAFYPLNASFAEFIYIMKTNNVQLTGISTASLFANAVIFTFYINAHRDKTAKGIFVSTLVYGIGVLLIKFTH